MMIAALLLAQTSAERIVHMSPAHYPAGSPIKDTQAPGGHANSDRLPTKNTTATPKDFITLTKVGGKINITFANHNQENLWFRAADGSLIMWLEAKDADTWKPIQYHNWYTCGNSYHRVNLPKGHNFNFETKVQSGFKNTQLRLAYFIDNGSNPNPPRYSDSVQFAIDERAFTLNPEQSKISRITTEWTTPTLVPKQ